MPPDAQSTVVTTSPTKAFNDRHRKNRTAIGKLWWVTGTVDCAAAYGRLALEALQAAASVHTHPHHLLMAGHISFFSNRHQ